VSEQDGSSRLASSVVAELLRRGVTDLVLAPGSRSAPVAFAAHDAARAGRLRLHTRIDERTAGFLALGLAKGSRRPVAVLTTSGTAVGNLLPAVLEAEHAAVPLILLTADRPAAMRGTGANQTANHVIRLTASFADVAPGEEERWGVLDTPGPVQLNLQLPEPLTADGDSSPHWPAAAESVRPTASTVPTPLSLGRRTVVVAGDDAGPPARVLAESADWPLLAEPSSGSRTGAHAMRTYRLLLEDDELARRVERVVVLGHPTLSRPVSRLLTRPDVEVVVVPGPGGPTNLGGHARVEPAVAAEGRDDPAWLEEWSRRDAEVGAALDALLTRSEQLLPHQVAGAVAAALPRDGLLFVGASNPIRDLDLMVPRYEVGGRRFVIANRGLSGIDGTVSSAIGATLGRPRTSRAFALVGDVTFLHDSNALVIGPEEPRPDLTVVVVNDDGGSIFASLEQGDPAHADSFERLFGTPHHVDLAALCAATRTPHWRVDSLAELRHALDSPAGGIEVVEAVVRRDNRRELDERIRGLAIR